VKGMLSNFHHYKLLKILDFFFHNWCLLSSFCSLESFVWTLLF
jgi:hypothetical protein